MTIFDVQFIRWHGLNPLKPPKTFPQLSFFEQLNPPYTGGLGIINKCVYRGTYLGVCGQIKLFLCSRPKTQSTLGMYHEGPGVAAVGSPTKSNFDFSLARVWAGGGGGFDVYCLVPEGQPLRRGKPQRRYLWSSVLSGSTG
jgi:hypothetical protein